MDYEHRQVGVWMLVPAAIIVTGSIFFWHSQSGSPVKFIVFPVAIVAMLLFSVLLTGVDARGVSWKFVAGFPSGFIPFEEIAAAEITHTSLFEGIGIHWTIWHGWLWNVSGFQAVMIRKRSGQRITIGTDDPHGFCDAIRARLIS